MSGGPPLGQPWFANVGNNPNINREPPPPSLNAAPGAPAQCAPAAGSAQVVVEQQHAPVYGPPVPIGIGGPGFGIAPPFGAGLGIGAFPPVIPPYGVGVGVMDPFMMYGGHGPGGGPLAPIRAGNFLPGAHGGIGFGLHAAGGMPFPPPPPGAVAGVLPPFAPAMPLWAPGGGLAFGNVPAVATGGMMGGTIHPMMGMGMGGFEMHSRPGPAIIEGTHGFPAQPPQTDHTAIAGGIPPGVTLIEGAEHTIIANIKHNVCPWLSPGAYFQMEFLAFASTTGLNRVIEVTSGLPSAECENWAVTECIELGNGFWEKGMTFKYGDAVARVLTIKDAGWDNKRNREGGQSLHIWAHQL